MNKRDMAITGVAGLALGTIIALVAATTAVNSNNTSMMRMMGMRTTTNQDGMMEDEDMSMGQMNAALEDKSGDEFDKAFIEMMIAHHQGAIEMAKLAADRAKHDEIKQLSEDILSAQSNEIDMMQSWQSGWGYSSVPRSHMMH